MSRIFLYFLLVQIIQNAMMEMIHEVNETHIDTGSEDIIHKHRILPSFLFSGRSAPRVHIKSAVEVKKNIDQVIEQNYHETRSAQRLPSITDPVIPSFSGKNMLPEWSCLGCTDTNPVKQNKITHTSEIPSTDNNSTQIQDIQESLVSTLSMNESISISPESNSLSDIPEKLNTTSTVASIGEVANDTAALQEDLAVLSNLVDGISTVNLILDEAIAVINDTQSTIQVPNTTDSSFPEPQSFGEPESAYEHQGMLNDIFVVANSVELNNSDEVVDVPAEVISEEIGIKDTISPAIPESQNESLHNVGEDQNNILSNPVTDQVTIKDSPSNATETASITLSPPNSFFEQLFSQWIGIMVGTVFSSIIFLVGYLFYQQKKRYPQQFLSWFENQSQDLFQKKNFAEVASFITTNLSKARKYFDDNHPSITNIKHILAKAYYALGEYSNSVFILDELLKDYTLLYGEDIHLAEIYEDRGLNLAHLEFYNESLMSLHQSLRIYSEEVLAQQAKSPLPLELINSPSMPETHTETETAIKLKDVLEATPMSDINHEEEETVVNSSYIDHYHHIPTSEKKYAFEEVLNQPIEEFLSNDADRQSGRGELTPTVKLHPNILLSPKVMNDVALTAPKQSLQDPPSSSSAYRSRLDNEFSHEMDCYMALKELEDLIDSRKNSPLTLPLHGHQQQHQNQTTSSVLSPSSSMYSIPYYSDLLRACHPSVIKNCKELADVYYQMEYYEQSLIFYCNTHALLLLANYEENSSERKQVFEAIQKNKGILDLNITLTEGALSDFRLDGENDMNIALTTAEMKMEDNSDNEKKRYQQIDVSHFLPMNKEDIEASSLTYYDVYHVFE